MGDRADRLARLQALKKAKNGKKHQVSVHSLDATASLDASAPMGLHQIETRFCSLRRQAPMMFMMKLMKMLFVNMYLPHGPR